jgi:Fic family protein
MLARGRSERIGICPDSSTNAKWAALGKCSAGTALRDINHLLARGVLRRLEGGAEYGV